MAIHELDHALGDAEPQPGRTHISSDLLVFNPELFEQVRSIFFGDSRPFVLDAKAQLLFAFLNAFCAQADANPPLLGILYCIANQVDQTLLYLSHIAFKKAVDSIVYVDLQAQAFGAGLHGQQADDALDLFSHAERCPLQGGRPALDAREIQDGVDGIEQYVCAVLQHVVQLSTGRRI